MEVMVSLVLLSILMGLFGSLFFQTIRSKEQLQQYLQTTEIATRILQTIGADLENCLRQTNALLDQSNSPTKGIQLLRFTLHNKKPRKSWIQYALQNHPQQENTFVLFRAVNGQYQELYDQVKKLTFQYWKEGKWQKTWPKDNLPPLAVKITLSLQPTTSTTPTTYSCVFPLPH